MELVVEALTCRRAGRRVVAPVSFAVPAGAAALLTGPNGAGKSSLLRVLAGLIPPEGGAARLGDLSLEADPEAWRGRLVYAGHLDAVKPALTVAENLAGWAAIQGGGGVAAALARFGLDRLADMPAGWCSAGQKRRLGLARLLVADRPLWLLDEPTVSLDAASVETLAQAVREHLAGGGLAVIATHAPLGVEGVAVRMAPPAAAVTDEAFGGAWT
jgi:heme exporter protein A